jgi:hypothetical protein
MIFMSKYKWLLTKIGPHCRQHAGIYWRRYYIWFILILALGIRLPNYNKSVEVDEMHSLDVAKPVGERLFYKKFTAGTWDAYETNIFIYKLSNNLIWFGSEAIVRLPYLLIGLLAIYFGWRLGRTWRFWYLAFWFALLLALWPLKVYWDGIIRHYTIMNFFWVLMILGWERFRLRPTFGRFLLAMLINVLAAWTHVVAVIVCVVPFIYVPWIWLVGIIRFRKCKELLLNKRRLFRNISLTILQIAILAASGLAMVTVNQGPNWTKQKIDTAWTMLNGHAAATPATTTGRAKNDINPPDPKRFFVEAAKAIKLKQNGFMPWVYLDPSWRAPFHMQKFFVGWEKMPTPAQATRLNWLLIGLLGVGGLFALLKSPPLFVANWIITFSTAMLLYFNADHHLYGVEPRYYMMAYSWLLFQAALGLAVLTWSIDAIASRFLTRRIALRCGILLCVSGAALILWLLWGAIGANRAFRLQSWKESYAWVHPPDADGIVLMGNGTFTYKYYNKLQWRREQLTDRKTGWNTYSNNVLLDFMTDFKMRDMAIVEQFNPRRYFITEFFSSAMPDRVLLSRIQPLLEKLPTQRTALDGSSKNAMNRIRLTKYDLGHHVFVLNGKLGMPLLPRLQLPTNDAHGYELVLHNEVPGTYSLRLFVSQSSLLRITLNDADVQFSTPPQQQRVEAFLDQAFHALPTSGTLINLRQPNQYVATIAIPTELLGETKLRLEFDSRPEVEPILNLRLKMENWTTISANFSVSEPVTYETNGRIYGGLILKAIHGYQPGQSYSYALRKMPEGTLLQNRGFAPISGLYGREPSDEDYFFIGPYELPALTAGQSFEFIQNPGNKSLGKINPHQPH